MSKRNDSILYSGSTSASYQAEKRKARIEQKLDEKRRFVPKADLVFEVIKLHKLELGEKLLKLTDENSDDNKVKDTLNAIRMHREFIRDLEGNLKMVLRVQPPKEKQSE